MIAFSCASLYSQPTTRSLQMEEEEGTLIFVTRSVWQVTS